jgi:hypothetical protein
MVVVDQWSSHPWWSINDGGSVVVMVIIVDVMRNAKYIQIPQRSKNERKFAASTIISKRSEVIKNALDRWSRPTKTDKENISAVPNLHRKQKSVSRDR